MAAAPNGLVFHGMFVGVDKSCISQPLLDAIVAGGGVPLLSAGPQLAMAVASTRTDDMALACAGLGITDVVTPQFVFDSMAAGALKPVVLYAPGAVAGATSSSSSSSSAAAAAAATPTPMATSAYPGSPATAKRPTDAGSSDAKKVKMIKKGKAPVDPKLRIAGVPAASLHVYEQGDTIYDCMLNQTNIGNNNNKFYVVQVLKSDTGNRFFVWNRWGRVGADGQSKVEEYGSAAPAVAAFESKFRAKTGNAWSSRHSFQPRAGLYTMLDIDYGSDSDDDQQKQQKLKDIQAAHKNIPASRLDPRVQELIKFISDEAAMTRAMVELEYDAKKMPLGKLKKTTIQQGYAVLKDIETELGKAAPNRHSLSELSSRFYTLIPHAFGMRIPPIISTTAMLKEKLAMLETLADIQIAQQLMRTDTAASLSPTNPIDNAYDKLKCALVPVDKTSTAWEKIVRYVATTHAPTHNNYRLQVLDIFQASRDDDNAAFSAQFSSVGNHQLLWHGSRRTNWMGILSQGLRIAPPEAPVTGYMFGKGVYFADVCSKSANYCCTSPTNSEGVMLLCEVALGNTWDLTAADSLITSARYPPGKHSVRGIGRQAPSAANAEQLDGVTVPMGPLAPFPLAPAYTPLMYPEYIVHTTTQARFKYLLRLKFDYRK